MRKNNKKVRSIKDSPISSQLAKVLLLLLNNNKIDSDLYNQLMDSEKDLVESLISTNKTIDKLHHTRYNQSEIDELINKYNILKGELLIGNNNPDLLKDLKLTIIQLVNYNILQMRDILPLLQTILLLI